MKVTHRAPEPDPGDRRAVRLSLTDSAQRDVDRWRDERAAVVAEGLGRLDPGERQALAAALPALTRLTAAVRPDEPVGAAT